MMKYIPWKYDDFSAFLTMCLLVFGFTSFSAEAAIVKTAMDLPHTIRSPFTAQCDINQDASLDEAEFVAFYRLDFARDDRNADGVLSMREMGITRDVPKDSQAASSWGLAEFQAMAFHKRDKNADGVISWSETAGGLSKGFHQLDRDHNARLTRNELGPAFSPCFIAQPVKTAALQ